MKNFQHIVRKKREIYPNLALMVLKKQDLIK